MGILPFTVIIWGLGMGGIIFFSQGSMYTLVLTSVAFITFLITWLGISFLNDSDLLVKVLNKSHEKFEELNEKLEELEEKIDDIKSN